jgi:hypothetical protein
MNTLNKNIIQLRKGVEVLDYPSGERCIKINRDLGGISKLILNCLKNKLPLHEFLLNTNGGKRVKKPVCVIRVDDFPRWDLQFSDYEKFHNILRNNKIPYLLGVTPHAALHPLEVDCTEFLNLEKDEIEFLKAAKQQSVTIAFHGYNHKTNGEARSEFDSIDQRAIEQKIENGLRYLKENIGVTTDIMIPPFNHFGRWTIPILGKYFRIICGGPETLPILGLAQSPSLLEDNIVYIPSYRPLYGRTAYINRFLKKFIKKQKYAFLPITIHWAWEENEGYKDLQEFCSLIQNFDVISWDNLKDILWGTNE